MSPLATGQHAARPARGLALPATTRRGMLVGETPGVTPRDAGGGAPGHARARSSSPFAALVVVLAIVIATRPSTYRVERSTRIAAPPEVVFALVNDFHAWRGWSPWERLDPT